MFADRAVSGRKQTRVMMWPTSSGANPYAQLVVDALQAAGVLVQPPSVRAILRPWTAMHMHWPDWTIRDRSFLVGLMRVFALALVLSIQRALGTKIVWTVHNLSPHGACNPFLERMLYRMLRSKVDLQIHLAAATATEMRQVSHICAGREYRVIPIGIYPSAPHPIWPPELEGVRKGVPLVSLLGAIHPYKGIPDLIQAFEKLPTSDSETQCVIAGLPEDREHANQLKTLARVSPRNISVLARRLEDEEFEALVERTTLFVVPFTSILNSSSVIKALSVRVPVLVPNSPSFEELRGEVGTDWVLTYSGRLSARTLSISISRAQRTIASDGEPDLSGRTWKTIASDLVDAYSEPGR